MGEGLAIGTSYATGEIALGTFLVVGFLLHNTTEGLGIISPLADRRPGLGWLLLLGAVAGLPTVLGAWVGVSTGIMASLGNGLSLAVFLIGAFGLIFAIEKPKESIGEYGFISLVYDSEGNMIGLHSRK